jgi:hypothetical protein
MTARISDHAIRLFFSWFMLLSITASSAIGAAPQSKNATAPAGDIAGMYTFLREGEFVQLTVEDGKLSGYVSRFGDSADDKGEFIDQFFDKTSLVGNHLTFNTKTVHGVWYDFTGTVANFAKKPNEEGARVIRGTLVQHTTDASGADKPMQRQVEFKSFPAEMNR